MNIFLIKIEIISWVPAAVLLCRIGRLVSHIIGVREVLASLNQPASMRLILPCTVCNCALHTSLSDWRKSVDDNIPWPQRNSDGMQFRIFHNYWLWWQMTRVNDYNNASYLSQQAELEAFIFLNPTKVSIFWSNPKGRCCGARYRGPIFEPGGMIEYLYQELRIWVPVQFFQIRRRKVCILAKPGHYLDMKWCRISPQIVPVFSCICFG